MTETQQLIAEYVNAGSDTAFRTLVERYVNLVYGTALRYVHRDAHLAQDVTQIVFADLARMARGLSADVKLGGWLHRHTCFIASKTIRSERRREQRERKSMELNESQAPAAPSAIFETGELDQAINELPDADRMAIVLRFFEQREFKAVGTVLGISDEAARKRVARAVDKLHIRLTRRGATISTAALIALVTAETSSSAPVGLVAGIVTPALASAASKAGIFTAVHLTVLLITSAAATTSVALLEEHSKIALRRDNEQLQMRLANTEKKITPPAPNRPAAIQSSPLSTDQLHELLRLRGEVGALREQSNELQRLRGELGQNQTSAGRDAAEPADISYNFPGLPLFQLLDIYGRLANKSVQADPRIISAKTVRIVTQYRLTKSEAMRVIEQAIREQCHAIFKDGSNGSLVAIPDPDWHESEGRQSR